MTKSRVRSTAVVVHNDKILCFIGKDPYSGTEYHFLPGGRIETGETAPDAAVRETLEETGYDIRLSTSSALDKEYSFNWNNDDYDCLTIFYRGYLKNPFQQPRTVKDASYNLRVEWVPVTNAAEVFGYTAEIRDAVLELCAYDESAEE